MDVDALKADMRAFGAQRTAALAARDEASARLDELIVSAKAAGVSISEIARLSGMSRTAVYDVLRERA